MDISQELLNNIKSQLTIKTKDIYDMFLLKKDKKTFEEYLDTLLLEIVESLEDFEQVDPSMLEPINDRKQDTKRRWVKKELNNISSSYNEDIKLASKLHSKVSIEKFKIVYSGCTDIKTLKAYLSKEFKNWIMDSNEFITSFKYIKDMINPKSIRSALKNDIYYFVLNCLLKETKEKVKVEYPNTYANIPVDCSKRNKLDLASEIIIDNKKYLINDYYIDDENIFRTLVNTEDIKKEALAKAVIKTFNTLDHKVFTNAMSARDDAFLTTQKINVPIGDIVEKIFASDNSKNYNAVKLSLTKMGLIKCLLFNKKNKDSSIFGLFDNVDFKTSLDNKKREIAIIKVNECIISDFIYKRTISIYSDKFKKLSDMANIIAIHLQKIRLSNCKGKDFEYKLTYNIIRSFINFGKKKKSHFKLINEKLLEIQNNNLIIKDFSLRGNTFCVLLHALSPLEEKDFIEKKLSFIDDIEKKQLI